MEHFIVSARKHRPTEFNEVVGQRSITSTLENAIASGQLAQALLFTGPRGVGKTTCARILAKKINETSAQQTDEDFAFNIFELDAASNNSVDDIRELIDQVRVPPQVGKYKVYIIDEVHMLSTAAFNAFLKTLEEPPNHAIFILATTEKHKIIPTILSRCQIFDFKRISVLDTRDHLQSIAEKEGIIADEDALHIIAQKADGALRDALSAFDRVVGFSGKHITREAVAESLNVLDYSYYFEITYLLLKNDIPNAFLAYNTILNKGHDGHEFIRGLASHFRDLLVSQNESTIVLLEVSDTVKQMYLKQSKMASTAFLKEGIRLTNACDLAYKNSQNQRLLVELCLLELGSLTSTEEKKIEVKRVTLAPESVIRSSDSPMLSPTKETDNKKATQKKETTTSAPVEQDNNQVSQQQEKAPVAEEVEVAIETETDQVNKLIEVEETKEVLASEKSETTIEATTEEINQNLETEVDESSVHIETATVTQPTSVKETTITPSKQPDKKEKPKRTRVSSLSLSSVEKRQQLLEEIEAKKPVQTDLPTEPFTQEEFEKVWEEYSNIVSKNRQHNLSSHLGMSMPKIKGHIAHVEYPNNTIKIEVERNSGSLLEYIRKKLQNYDFDLKITVNEEITKKYTYTDREIYEKMTELNPKLDVFRQQLDLDF